MRVPKVPSLFSVLAHHIGAHHPNNVIANSGTNVLADHLGADPGTNGISYHLGANHFGSHYVGPNAISVPIAVNPEPNR